MTNQDDIAMPILEITRVACRAFNVPYSEMVSTKTYRGSEHTITRAAVAHVAHEKYGFSFPEIAQALSHPSHATFVDANRRANKLLGINGGFPDPDFTDKVNLCIKSCQERIGDEIYPRKPQGKYHRSKWAGKSASPRRVWEHAVMLCGGRNTHAIRLYCWAAEIFCRASTREEIERAATIRGRFVEHWLAASSRKDVAANINGVRTTYKLLTADIRHLLLIDEGDIICLGGAKDLFRRPTDLKELK